MMKYALVINDVIDTISYDPVGGWITVGDDVFGGFIRDGAGWKAPPPIIVPPPVPEELSRWQFFAAAALAGIITQDQAKGALTGTMPPPFVAFIATLPQADRFEADMLLTGNQIFHRHHPFVQAFLNANQMTSDQADAIWRAGAALGT
ncbi:hypothetical protein [Labrys neptuniae]